MPRSPTRPATRAALRTPAIAGVPRVTGTSAPRLRLDSPTPGRSRRPPRARLRQPVRPRQPIHPSRPAALRRRARLRPLVRPRPPAALRRHAPLHPRARPSPPTLLHPRARPGSPVRQVQPVRLRPPACPDQGSLRRGRARPVDRRLELVRPRSPQRDRSARRMRAAAQASALCSTRFRLANRSTVASPPARPPHGRFRSRRPRAQPPKCLGRRSPLPRGPPL